MDAVDKQEQVKPAPSKPTLPAALRRDNLPDARLARLERRMDALEAWAEEAGFDLGTGVTPTDQERLAARTAAQQAPAKVQDQTTATTQAAEPVKAAEGTGASKDASTKTTDA